MKKYETTFVLDSTLDNESIEREIKKVSDIIVNAGGSILKLERWGVKRFAYPIARRQQGFYTYILFEGSPKTPPELEKVYKLNEACLRYLTVVYSGEEKPNLPEKSPEVPAASK
ncbi:MAG: 30S ribosomal protein S6 [candidate division Zixibacteria bacterium RBG_16_40_9]|nr:MAG: 30S ribosomal protein S6 [candidate division Zixibacteria bacterium RBG_16_40_9]